MLPRIVFFGSSDFSAAVLADLYQKGFPIPLVVTQPDKPFGRKRVLHPPPVKIEAQKLGIEIIQPTSLRKKGVLSIFQDLEFDFGVVCAYGKILPKKLLDTAQVNFLNTHASNLPRFRGAAPMERAIMEGDTATAMCIMEVSEGLDEGDVFHREFIEISADMKIDQLQELMLNSARNLLPEVLSGYPRFLKEKTPQADEGIFYASKIREEDSWMDLNWPGKKIYNHLRALGSTYGISFRTREGKKIAVFQGDFEVRDHDLNAGEVFQRTKRSLSIALLDGILTIREIQMEGKKKLPIQAFLAGYQVKEGACFLHSAKLGEDHGQ